MDINKEVITWLLDDKNPSIRYYTLKCLLGKTDEDPEVSKTKENIMKIGLVPKILKKQNEDGSFAEPEKFYTNKYKGTIWTLLVLAELGADKDNPQIKKACEYVLNNSQDKMSGGFSVKYSTTNKGGLPSMVIPCLTGNMVFTLLKFGYLEDPRLIQAINWIVEFQRTDDGVYEKPLENNYKRLKSCFGKHSCHMGVAKALKALAEIPIENRTEEVNEKIEQLSEYFLKHHIYKKSHELSLVSKKGWLNFGFPLMYQTDVLEMLEVFKKLNIYDNRLQSAIDVVKSNEVDGYWILKNSFNGKMQTSIEKKGEVSKWITMKSLVVLNHFN